MLSCPRRHRLYLQIVSRLLSLQLLIREAWFYLVKHGVLHCLSNKGKKICELKDVHLQALLGYLILLACLGTSDGSQDHCFLTGGIQVDGGAVNMGVGCGVCRCASGSVNDVAGK